MSGNVYAGTCQPRSRRALETSKTVKLSTSSLELEGEHRQLVAAGEKLERSELRDPGRQAGRDVARVLLHLPVALEPEPDEVVVLRDDLRARA